MWTLRPLTVLLPPEEVDLEIEPSLSARIKEGRLSSKCGRQRSEKGDRRQGGEKDKKEAMIKGHDQVSIIASHGA